MDRGTLTLSGRFVRLEPLAVAHAEGLSRAAEEDPSLYKWSFVPQSLEAVKRYIDTALTWQQEGTAVPFATVRLSDGVVVGSTRFFEMKRWHWPVGHERDQRTEPDICEIGYTWLSASAIRAGINTEAKLLMLTHAFETWGVLGVCFHTDARNDRSRAALERIGARFEGILRAHRLASDYTPRNSARFSITAEEWPLVKEGLKRLMIGAPRT